MSIYESNWESARDSVRHAKQTTIATLKDENANLRGCVYKNQTSSGKLQNLKIPETLAISRPY